MLYLDDDLPNHPKILKAGARLGANGPAQALAVFVIGLSYARKFLTDGRVPDTFVTSLRHVDAPIEVAKVLSSRGVQLWHRTRGGYQIHDYHGWNPKASQVKEKREKERLKKSRQRASESRVSLDVSPAMSPQDSVSVSPMLSARTTRASRARAGCGSGTGSSGFDLKGGTGENGNGASHTGEVPLSEREVRAGRFCERYAELFYQFRRGARYVSKPALDYQEALLLVDVWDDSRLDTLVEAFLTTDEAFCRNGAGNIAQFRSRASWCDGKLREAGL